MDQITMKMSALGAQRTAKGRMVQPKVIDKYIEDAYDNFTRFTSENLFAGLRAYQVLINQYLINFNKTYLKFLAQSEHVQDLVRTLPLSAKQDVEDTAALKRVQELNQEYRKIKDEQATQEYIKTLLQGKTILMNFRTALTNQVINTVLTVVAKGNTYRVDEDVLKPYLGKGVSYGLSTYGSSVNNPFSLCLTIDRRSTELIAALTSGQMGEEITQSDIYQTIWDRKPDYLKQYKTGKNYKLVFNSKDAEIYDLLSQMKQSDPLFNANAYLTVGRYADLRASMGGGGGYRTSMLKAGDVGLTQDKMIGAHVNSVNIARSQLIYEGLQRLNNILLHPESSTLQQDLKNMFIEKEQNLKSESDVITRLATEEAEGYVESLFSGLTK